jgi:hypothetical protein
VKEADGDAVLISLFLLSSILISREKINKEDRE